MNAQLPEHMVQVTIKDMIVGEEAFAVSWAMQVDQDGQCWIRGDYDFTSQPFGTSEMRIKKTRDGFEVTVPHDKHYTPRYLSPEDHELMTLMPVVKVN